MGLRVNILKMMMGHPISEKPGLSHQSDHECSGNYHPLTYRHAPVRGKVKNTLVSILKGQGRHKKASVRYGCLVLADSKPKFSHSPPVHVKNTCQNLSLKIRRAINTSSGKKGSTSPVALPLCQTTGISKILSNSCT